MPLYDFVCSLCGQATDHQCLIAERFTKIDCPSCGAEGSCELVVGYTRPNFASQERKRGDKRLIFDEREVIAEKGERWRDEGTTGREGGAGKRQYFHK